MQVIEPTFRRYALRWYEDWKNPLHNTIAAIRYIADKYGSPYNLPKGGYLYGGIVPFDGFGFLHMDEIVLPKDIGDLIRRAVRTQAAFSSASTGVGRVLTDAATSLVRDTASVGGVPFGPASQPAAAPVPPFVSARDSAPASEGGITLEPRLLRDARSSSPHPGSCPIDTRVCSMTERANRRCPPIVTRWTIWPWFAQQLNAYGAQGFAVVGVAEYSEQSMIILQRAATPEPEKERPTPRRAALARRRSEQSP